MSLFGAEDIVVASFIDTAPVDTTCGLDGTEKFEFKTELETQYPNTVEGNDGLQRYILDLNREYFDSENTTCSREELGDKKRVAQGILRDRGIEVD